MNRQEFLKTLENHLSALPQKDLSEQLEFYSEMLADRIEDGLSEEDAVAAVGSPLEIAEQILAEYPLLKLVKEKIKPKKQLSVWVIVLLTLGSPIWLAILISLFAVIFSVYVSLWAIIISLWSVFVSLIACAVGFLIAGTVFCFCENVFSGIFLFGAGFICAGFSIFASFGCKAATKGIIWLTKKIVLSIKGSLIKKEGAKNESL